MCSNLSATCKRMKLDHFLGWMKALNVRPENHKGPKKGGGVKLLNICLKDFSLDLTLKTRATKGKQTN